MHDARRTNSLVDSLKLFKDRITFSRLTIAYFAFSLVHFTLQISLQSRAFSINALAARSLADVVKQGDAFVKGFTVYEGNELRVCENIPMQVDSSSCRVLWDGTPRTDNWSPRVKDIASTPLSITFAPSSTGTLSRPLTSSSSSISSTSQATSTSSSAFNTGSILRPSSSSSPSSSLSPTQTSSSIRTQETIPVVKLVIPTFSTTTTSAARFARPTPNGATRSNPTVLDASDISADLPGDDETDDYPNGLFTLSKRHPVSNGIMAVKNSNGTVSVKVTGFGYDNTGVVLSSQCLTVLNYPVNVLRNTKREDVTFIAFHFWVLGMSFVALLNESIPHIIASLLSHILATAWAGFQLYHTADFRKKFVKLTTQGACQPVNLLGPYWKERSSAEIPSFALNVLALLISAFLTWKLVKTFGWQTFKRIGASLTINRIYKIVLTMSITIQISVFFMICALGLWVDQLFNGSIGQLETQKALYRGFVISVIILLVPWLMTGWRAVRQENRLLMAIFLLFAFAYMVGWGIMFISCAFRWTFVEWRFFRLLSLASFTLTLASFILGVVCRLNFGQGLTRCLKTRDSFDGEGLIEETKDEEEKVDFPSRESPIPTFTPNSTLYQNQGPYATPQLGPRFFNQSTEPFESVTAPLPTYQRQGSIDYPANGQMLARTDSRRSNGSSESAYSHLTDSSRGSRKRWVIE